MDSSPQTSNQKRRIGSAYQVGKASSVNLCRPCGLDILYPTITNSSLLKPLSCHPINHPAIPFSESVSKAFHHQQEIYFSISLKKKLRAKIHLLTQLRTGEEKRRIGKRFPSRNIANPKMTPAIPKDRKIRKRLTARNPHGDQNFFNIADLLAHHASMPEVPKLMKQSNALWDKANNLMTVLTKALKPDYPKTYSLIGMNVVSSVLSVSYVVYNMFSNRNTVNYILGSAVIITQIVSSIFNIMVVLGVNIELTKVSKLVTEFFQEMSEAFEISEGVAQMEPMQFEDNPEVREWMKHVMQQQEMLDIRKEYYRLVESTDGSEKLDKQSFNYDLAIRGGSFLVSTLITIISMATGSQIDMKFIRNHQLRKAFEANFSDTQDLIGESMYTFFGVTIGDGISTVVALQKLHDEMSQALLIPDNKIFYDQGRYYQMLDLYRRSSEIMKVNIPLKQSGAQSLKISITQKHLELGQKLKLCATRMESLASRQETVAFHFFGNPGCGKTEFVTKHLIKEVAALSGNAPDVYTVGFSTEKDFWNEYAGQKYAVYDEFLQNNDEEKIREYMNKICSGAFVNLPGAFAKDQPCNFELLCLIGNKKFVKMTNKMSIQAQRAFYSRLKLYRVRNKYYSNFATITGGVDNGENEITALDRDKCAEFAQADWSHLIFEEVRVNYDTGKYLEVPLHERVCEDPHVFRLLTPVEMTKVVEKELSKKRLAYNNFLASKEKLECFKPHLGQDKPVLDRSEWEPQFIRYEQNARTNSTLLEAIVRHVFPKVLVTQQQIEDWLRDQKQYIPGTMNIQEVSRKLDDFSSVWDRDIWKFLAERTGLTIEIHSEDPEWQMLYLTGEKEVSLHHEKNSVGMDQLYVISHWNKKPQLEKEGNSTGVFVMMLHGPTGAGKTTYARQLASKLQSFTQLPIVEFSGKPPKPTKFPTIYIANDSVVHCEQWMSFYDSVCAGSIILASANVYVESRHPWQNRIYNRLPGVSMWKPYRYVRYMGVPMFQNPEVPEGWIRRVGIPGMLEYASNDFVQVENFLAMDVKFDKQHKMHVWDGHKYNETFSGPLEKDLVERIAVYHQRLKECILIEVQTEAELLKTEADVTVTAPTWEKLFDVLSSTSKILWAYLKPNNERAIKISNNLIYNATMRFDPGMFYVTKKPTTLAEAIEVAQHTYGQLRRDQKNFTVHVDCAEFEVFGQGQYIRYRVKANIEEDPLNYTIGEEGVTFHENNDHGNELFIDFETIAKYFYGGMEELPEQCRGQYYFVLTTLNKNKDAFLRDNKKVLYQMEKYQHETAIREQLRQSVKDGRDAWEIFTNSRAWKVCRTVLYCLGVIASVAGVGAVLASMFVKKKPEVVQNNHITMHYTHVFPLLTTIGKTELRLTESHPPTFKCVTKHRCDIPGIVNVDKDFISYITHNWGFILGLEPTVCKCGGDIISLEEAHKIYEYFIQYDPFLNWPYLDRDELSSDEESSDSELEEFQQQGVKSGGGKNKKKDSKKKRNRRSKPVHSSTHALEPVTYTTGALKYDPVSQREYREVIMQGKGADGYLTRKTTRPVAPRLGVSQGIERLPSLVELSDQTLEACIHYLGNAMVQLSCSGEMLHGIAYKDDYIVCPYHLLDCYMEMTPNANWEKAQVLVECDRGSFLAVPISGNQENDILLLKVICPTKAHYASCVEKKISPNWESMKDISSWFVQEDTFDAFKTVEMIRFGQRQTTRICGTASFMKYFEYTTASYQGTSFQGKGFEICYANSGQARTAKGDCGFPTVITDKAAGKQRILGMHIAALSVSKTPFSCVISQEMLSDMENKKVKQSTIAIRLERLRECELEKLGLDPLSSVLSPSDFLQVLDYAEPAVNLPEQIQDISVFGYHGPFGFTRNGRNMYSRTPWSQDISGLIPDQVRNSVTRVHDVVDKSKLVWLKDPAGNEIRQSIAWTQIVQYSDPWTWDGRRQGLLNDAADFLLSQYISIYAKDGFRILSDGEVINGIRNPADPYYGMLVNMDLTTSPGPYWINHGITKKSTLFQNTGTAQMPNYTIADTCHGRILNGIYRDKINYASVARVMMPAKDCLKMEKVKLEKAETGQTRVFVSVDLVDILYARKVAGTVLAAFKKNRARGYCQTGIDPVMDFSQLYERFRRKGEYGHAGDFKAFDKHLLKPVIKTAFTLIERLMTYNFIEGLGFTRDMVPALVNRLFEDFCDTLSVCEGVIYCKHKGNPSGNVLTCVVNSIINDLMVVSCTINLYRQSGIKHRTFDWVRKNIDWANLGDDLVVVLSEEAQSVVPFSKFCHEMLDLFSIVMTHPSKDLDFIPPEVEPLESLSFLSRQFVRVGSRLTILPRLKTITISGLLHWTSHQTTAQYYENIQEALEEAVLWDEEFYNTVVRAIFLATKRVVDLNVVFPPWAMTRREIIAKINNDSSSGELDLWNRGPARLSDDKLVSESVKSPLTMEGDRKQVLQDWVYRNLSLDKIRATSWLTRVQSSIYWTAHTKMLEDSLDQWCVRESTQDSTELSENKDANDMLLRLGESTVNRHGQIAMVLYEALKQQLEVVLFINPAQYLLFLESTEDKQIQLVVGGQQMTCFYKMYTGTRRQFMGYAYLLGMSQQEYFNTTPQKSEQKYQTMLRDVLKQDKFTANKGLVKYPLEGPTAQPPSNVDYMCIAKDLIIVQSQFVIMAMYTTHSSVVIWMDPKYRKEFDSNSIEVILKCVRPSGNVVDVRVRRYIGTKYPWKEYVFVLNQSLEDTTLTEEDTQAVQEMYEEIYPVELENGLLYMQNPAGGNGHRDDWRNTRLAAYAYMVYCRGHMVGWTYKNQRPFLNYLFLSFHQKRVCEAIHVQPDRTLQAAGEKEGLTKAQIQHLENQLRAERVPMIEVGPVPLNPYSLKELARERIVRWLWALGAPKGAVHFRPVEMFMNIQQMTHYLKPLPYDRDIPQNSGQVCPDTDFVPRQEFKIFNVDTYLSVKRCLITAGEKQSTIQQSAPVEASVPTPTATNKSVTTNVSAQVNNSPTSGSMGSWNFIQTSVNPVQMLAGGIMLDLVNMIYSTYFNLGGPIQYRQDVAIGTVLGTFSYGMSVLNTYAKQYIGMHRRKTGDILMRFIINGAQIFRGKIMVALFPDKQSHYTIVDAQRFNATLLPVNEDSVFDFKLHYLHVRDRWWETEEDLKGYQMTVVLLAYIDLINPFENPGSTVVIQPLSKLAPNFTLSYPIMTIVDDGQHDDDLQQLLGQTFAEFVSTVTGNTFSGRILLAMDGHMYPDREIRDVPSMYQTPAAVSFQDVRNLFVTQSRMSSFYSSFSQDPCIGAHVEPKPTDLNLRARGTPVADVTKFLSMALLGVAPVNSTNTTIDKILRREDLDTADVIDDAYVMSWAKGAFDDSYVLRAQDDSFEWYFMRHYWVTETDTPENAIYCGAQPLSFSGAVLFVIVHSKGVSILAYKDVSVGSSIPTGSWRSTDLSGYTETSTVLPNLETVSTHVEVLTHLLDQTLQFTLLQPQVTDFDILPESKVKILFSEIFIPVITTDSQVNGLASLSGSWLPSMLAKWATDKITDPTNESIDFQLSNPDFGTAVLTLRYQPSVKTWMINPVFPTGATRNEYLVYAGKSIELLEISGITVKKNNQPIGITQVQNWLERTTTNRALVAAGAKQAAIAGMMIGGSALSGIGQGLSSYAQYQQQLQLLASQQAYNSWALMQNFNNQMALTDTNNQNTANLQAQNLEAMKDRLEYTTLNQREMQQAGFEQQANMQNANSELQMALLGRQQNFAQGMQVAQAKTSSELARQNFFQNADLSSQNYRQNSALQKEQWESGLEYQQKLQEMKGVSTGWGQWQQGEIMFGGQQDRVGLGQGRYGSVPPPAGMSQQQDNSSGQFEDNWGEFKQWWLDAEAREAPRMSAATIPNTQTQSGTMDSIVPITVTPTEPIVVEAPKVEAPPDNDDPVNSNTVGFPTTT